MGSYDDWDFQNVNWALSETVYHTAPPGLDFTGTCTALVKNATTGALSDGRLVAWVRNTSTTTLCYLMFRNQVADGDADYADTYYIRIAPAATGIVLYRLIEGASDTIEIKKHTWAWAINTWYKLRVTWWTAFDRLNVRVERWTGTEWVTLGGAADEDMVDPDDQFKDAAVNRCGFLGTGTLYIDDLEVWA